MTSAEIKTSRDCVIPNCQDRAGTCGKIRRTFVEGGAREGERERCRLATVDRYFQKQNESWRRISIYQSDYK